MGRSSACKDTMGSDSDCHLLLYACARFRCSELVEGTESGDGIVSASDTRHDGMTREKRGRRKTKILIAATGNRSFAWYACSLVPYACLSELLVRSVPWLTVARDTSKSSCTSVDTCRRRYTLEQDDQDCTMCSLKSVHVLEQHHMRRGCN